MPGKRNWWTVLSAIASGILVGFAFSTIAYRLQLLRVPSGGIVQRMNRDLNLTPAQQTQISDLLAKTSNQIAEIRAQSRDRERQAMARALDGIRSTLRPEQQQRFDRLYNPNKIGIAQQQ